MKSIRKIVVMMLAVVMVVSMSAVSFAGSKISEKQAVNKALNDAGLKRSEVRDLDSEYDDGKYEVEFTRKSNKAEYEYEISKTGRILEKDVNYKYKHNSSKKKIGKDAARQKVAKFSGINIKYIKRGTCKYEYEDREGTYDIEFRYGNYEYEYEVLAPTGKIIEYSKDYK